MLRRDLDLHVEVDGIGPPLLLLHGFSNSVASWHTVRSDLSAQFRLILVDLIGHGQSASPAELARYTTERAIEDLLGVLDALELAPVHLLGYSMGGRLALRLALAAPERFLTLTLESATAGIDDGEERKKRVADDEALADRIEREGIANFVAYWESLPLLALAPHVPEAIARTQHAQRLRNHPLGLANSLRGMGAGRQQPVWDRLPELALRTLVISGERDARYVEIAHQLAERLPRADLRIAPEAGHTVHLDRPAWFVEQVIDFLCHNEGRSSV